MLHSQSWAAGSGDDESVDYYLRLAVNNPDWYGAVNLIANRVGSADGLKIQYRKEGEDEWKDQLDHPFLSLLRRPNSFFPGILMSRELVWWALSVGDGYWFGVTDMPGIGPIREIWPLPARLVKPRPDRLRLSQLTGDPIIDYEYTLGQGVLLPGENVLHVRTANLFDYWQGMGAMNPMQTSFDAAHAQREWISEYFGEGNAVPTAILSVPAELDDEEFEAVRLDLQREFAARRRAAIVRAGDLDAEMLSHSIEEMQVYEGIAYHGSEARRVLGVPEGIYDASSGTERIAAEIALGKNAVQPLLELTAAFIDLQFMPYYAVEGYEVRCVADDVVPQDRALEATEYQTYAPDRTINEAREKQSLDPITFSGALAALQPLLDEVPQQLIPVVAPMLGQGAGGPGSAPGMNGNGGQIDKRNLLMQLMGRDEDALVAILAGRDADSVLRFLSGRDGEDVSWQEKVERQRALTGNSPLQLTGNAGTTGASNGMLESGAQESALPKQDQMMLEMTGLKSAAIAPEEREAILAAAINAIKAAGKEPNDVLMNEYESAKSFNEDAVNRYPKGTSVGEDGSGGGRFAPKDGGAGESDESSQDSSDAPKGPKLPDDIAERVVIGERPTAVSDERSGSRVDLPSDWVIYNAPRPIFGTVSWRGDFITGVFYTAIDPADPEADRWHTENKKQDAKVINYLSEDDAFARGRQRMIDEYGDGEDVTGPIDDPSNRDWVVSSYLDFANQSKGISA